jgi:hypothetical protein
MTTEEYCREIESYLCRKNDGHLIRIVGPSFDLVQGWATQGVPFKIACQGIDRYFVRYYAKGARRRPVHIDFCEADVLDAFDAWRRSVGVRLPGHGEEAGSEGERRKKSLPDHLARVCERITLRRARLTPPPPALDDVLEQVVSEVAAFRDQAGPLRGEARARAIARLTELDRQMLDAARMSADPAAIQAAREEALEQLRPFRDRMAGDVFEQAVRSAADRLLRDREGLPTVGFE